MHCWNCTGFLCAGPFCEVCKKIQPLAPEADAFAVLGLDRRFALDPASTESRYRELQRKLHPDRFALAQPNERQMSLQWATAVNDAHRVLSDPIRRAEYLLERAGLRISEENGGGPAKVDPAFLAEVMELRENLAEALVSHDAARVAQMAEKVAAERDEIVRGLAERFGAWEKTGDDRALVPIAPLLGRLRYYKRFLDEAQGTEAER